VGIAIFHHAILKKIVGFNDMHDMRGYEEQLLNAMCYFGICAYE